MTMKYTGQLYYNYNGICAGEVVTMSYRQYKQHYADCHTIQGTYNALYKTIDVVVPSGREKKSGTRCKHYDYFDVYLIDNKIGIAYKQKIKAMSEALAEKQIAKLLKDFKGELIRVSKEEAEAYQAAKGGSVETYWRK